MVYYYPNLIREDDRGRRVLKHHGVIYKSYELDTSKIETAIPLSLRARYDGNALKYQGVSPKSYELDTSKIETAIPLSLTSWVRRKCVETPRREP
jgi:hypothetical protein